MPRIEIIVALDVGDARIGVAAARSDVRLAQPRPTIVRTDRTPTELAAYLEREGATRLVIGLPRGLDGQETAQTAATRAFAAELGAAGGLAAIFQDEALTSVQAEAELTRRGKPYVKADIDALAAVYILEDYLRATEQELTHA